MEGRLEDIRAALADGDHEKAHSLEDDLYRDTLQAITDGDLGPRTMRHLAWRALQTKDLPIDRQCY